MKLYITTLGREGRQITLNQIPNSWKEKTYLVCPKEEVHDWPNRIDVPEYCQGYLAKTRQWVMEMSDDKHVGLLDDDIRFYKRDSENKTKRTLASESEMTELFDMFDSWLKEGDVYCACSNSFRSHENPSEYYYGKPSHCFFFDRDYLAEQNIRFDDIFTFEDFHVPISILKSGKRLRLTGEYISQEKKANAPGGCSITRNGMNNRNSMLQLAQMHPNYVTVKESPGAKNQGLIVNLKMRIGWKKLYENVRSE